MQYSPFLLFCTQKNQKYSIQRTDDVKFNIISCRGRVESGNTGLKMEHNSIRIWTMDQDHLYIFYFFVHLFTTKDIWSSPQIHWIRTFNGPNIYLLKRLPQFAQLIKDFMKKRTQTSYRAYNEGLQIIYEKTLATGHKI